MNKKKYQIFTSLVIFFQICCSGLRKNENIDISWLVEGL